MRVFWDWWGWRTEPSRPASPRYRDVLGRLIAALLAGLSEAGLVSGTLGCQLDEG